MPRLPSGIVVNIVHERARYHALRQRRRVTQRTPHQRLHSLIDIVYPNPDVNPAQWDRNYVFTGHTLDDLRWLDKWREDDRRFFLDWINQPEQRRAIDLARRRLLAEPGNLCPEVVTFPYHEEFYSELYRRIRSLPMTKASPEQWQRTLQRMLQQGVRAEELQWSGLPDYLREQHHLGTSRIYRDELASRIDFRHIRAELVNELAPPGKARLSWRECARLLDTQRLERFDLPTARRALIRLEGVERRYQICLLQPAKSTPGSAPLWFILDPFCDPLAAHSTQLFTSCEQAIAAADQHARQHYLLHPPPAQPMRNYDYVTLAGGSDYREWLVTLPDYQRSHFTGHYLERNLLLHMRTKVRQDHMGRRLLFIEEMQSDWHQYGARHGYDNRFDGPTPVAPYRKEWPLLGLKLLLMHLIKEGLHGIAWTTGELQDGRYGRHIGPVHRLYSQLIPDFLTRLCRPWEVTPTTTRIDTLDPWLQAWRKGDKWYVKSADGRFITRPRLEREEAEQLIARHSRRLSLEVPMLVIPQPLREQILEDGLPLFGDHLVPLDKEAQR